MTRRFLSILGILWLVWLAVDVVRGAFAGSSAADGRLDATGQFLQSDAWVADEPVQARLQIALLQMAADGPQTAVICATSVPLQRDALRQVLLHVDWRPPRTPWQGRRLDRSHYEKRVPTAGQFRAMSWDAQEAFGDLERGVSFGLRWRGARAGLDFLTVEWSHLRYADSDRGTGRRSDWLPSLAIAPDMPHFLWLSHSDAVLALCVQDAGQSSAPWTTLAEWQWVARASSAVPALAPATVPAEPGDPAEGYVWLSAELSRAAAHLVFLDRELSPQVRAVDPGDRLLAGGDAALEPAMAELLDLRSTASLVVAASSPEVTAAGFEADWFLDDHVLPLRALCMREDPTQLLRDAAALPDFYAPTLLAFAEVPVHPAVATVWAQVLDQARERLWPEWQRWLPLPLRWGLLLAPLALLLWLSLRWRSEVQGPVRLGGPTLLVVTLLGVQLPRSSLLVEQQILLLVMLLVMAVSRLAPATPRLDRVQLAVAFTGVWLLLLWGAGLDHLLGGTVLAPLVGGNVSTWLVLGAWVLRDGQWRVPAWFACSLLVDVLLAIAVAVLGRTLEELLPIWLLLQGTGCMCLLAFLLCGHRRAPVTPPVAVPAAPL